ncbi:MAG: hypothetical protein AAGF67_12700 [Verrucomicrobiota bacterium]
MSEPENSPIEDAEFLARIDEVSSVMTKAVDKAVAENKELDLEISDVSEEKRNSPRVAED